MKFRFKLRTLLLLMTLLGLGLGAFIWQKRIVDERRAAIRFLLHKTQRIDGDNYRCVDMVKLVNRLRASGKREALYLLQQHFIESKELDSRNIFLVCRCLFQNPAGWDPPGLGMPHPLLGISLIGEYPADFIKEYPAFPIAFSKGLPFLVTRGYAMGGGVAESPGACLHQCQSLQLVPADLPTTGFAAAAQSLVEEPRFTVAYPDKDTRQEMAQMILKQAEETEAEE